jgi:hypothetical protein
MTDLLANTRATAFIAASFLLNEAEIEHNRIYPNYKTQTIRITANFDLNLYSIYAEIKLTESNAFLAVEQNTANEDLTTIREEFVSTTFELIQLEYTIDGELAPPEIENGVTYTFQYPDIPLTGIPVDTGTYENNPRNINYEVDYERMKLLVFATIPFKEPTITNTGAIVITPIDYG